VTLKLKARYPFGKAVGDLNARPIFLIVFACLKHLLLELTPRQDHWNIARYPFKTLFHKIGKRYHFSKDNPGNSYLQGNSALIKLCAD